MLWKCNATRHTNGILKKSPMPSKSKLTTTTPEWAEFLRRELPILHNLSAKRLRILAKRAHLNAGGGKSDLISKLNEFVSLVEPPDWFAQEKRKQDFLVEVRDKDKTCCLKVGQFLKIVCISRKMSGCSVRIDKE